MMGPQSLHLLYEPKDFSLSSWTHVQTLCPAAQTCNLSLKQAEAGGILGFASQPLAKPMNSRFPGKSTDMTLNNKT